VVGAGVATDVGHLTKDARGEQRSDPNDLGQAGTGLLDQTCDLLGELADLPIELPEPADSSLRHLRPH
jgi:hypothetical protein